MNILHLAAAICLTAGGLCSPVLAKPISSEFRQIRSGEVPAIRGDRAYLLLRIDTSISRFSASILRVPGADEIAAYQTAKRAAHAKAGPRAGPLDSFAFSYKGRPNLFEFASGQHYFKDGAIAVSLAEVSPGDYIFYGESVRGYLYECFCLGTLRFEVRAGEVVDLGTMLIAYASKPSAIPELAGETNLGPSAFMDYALWAVALRPAGASAAVPAGLDATKVRPARLRAVAPFVEANTMLINRLAPIPGVLAYDGGRVIDVTTGKDAAPN